MSGHSPEWFLYGRAVLVRAAVRAGSGRPPDGVADAGDSEPAGTDTAGDGAEDAAVAEAWRAFGESLDGAGPFAALAANAGLSRPEADVLAVVAAAEADAGCQALVAAIQGDPNRNRVAIGSLGGLLGSDHPGPLAVAHDSALRRSVFVDVVEQGPWADHVVAVHPGVVWALLGDNSPDPDLPVEVSALDADDFDATVPDTVDRSGESLMVVVGDDRMRRRHAAVRRAMTDRFLCCTAPDDDREWGALVREATITGRGLLVEIDDRLDTITQRWLRRATHLVWVISAKSAPPIDQFPDRAWAEILADPADPTDDEWVYTFGGDVERTHHLTFDQMHRVQRARRALGGDIDAAVRRLASGPLEQLTRRIVPTRTWDDIVLSDDRLGMLRSIADRYRHSSRVYDDWGFTPTPSRGLVALFSGPSGTGKTLASEIIAAELGLEVFKLDLSSVVSKYIGETEKNLEQIFDAASAGNLVLFFDEADSLFGKRSEVKDARDRYANIEVSYLLQRLEIYDGMVIMATNFEKNVDEAFLRRIHVRIEFALPGPAERLAIWRQNLPSSAPLDGVDLPWLADQFELSGGSIRNAAVHAAFTAATAGTPITMECAVNGVARELRKMGRLLKDKDFGQYHGLVAL